MNSKRAKLIMKQARKNSRTGKAIISQEYDRLKKEHKEHSQDVKQKPSPRQERRRHFRLTEETKLVMTEAMSKLINVEFKKPTAKNLSVKSKAHRYPRVRIQTRFGYRTL